MRTPKIYIETSVFNNAISDQSPEMRNETLKLFKEIEEGKFIPYTSAYVEKEIDEAPEHKKEEMYNIIKDMKIKTLGKNNDIDLLADEYIKEKIIPEDHRMDALHIAAATVNDLDIIVSWNFRHIVKRKTMILTELVNKRNGYNEVEIYSPTEVTEDGI